MTNSAAIRTAIRAGIARMNQSKDSSPSPTPVPPTPPPAATPASEAAERTSEDPAMMKMPLVVDTGRRPAPRTQPAATPETPASQPKDGHEQGN